MYDSFNIGVVCGQEVLVGLANWTWTFCSYLIQISSLHSGLITRNQEHLALLHGTHIEPPRTILRSQGIKETSKGYLDWNCSVLCMILQILAPNYLTKFETLIAKLVQCTSSVTVHRQTPRAPASDVLKHV